LNNVLQVAGIKRESLFDGPGIRMTLFVQGCPRDCYGCHNPETRDPHGGVEMDIKEVLEYINKSQNLDGITYSGGEPFMQAEPLAVLGQEIKRLGLHLITYTGYTFEEIWERSVYSESDADLLRATQILVDGPYLHDEKELNFPFKGSKNQRIIDVASSLQKGYPVTISHELWGGVSA